MSSTIAESDRKACSAASRSTMRVSHAGGLDGRRRQRCLLGRPYPAGRAAASDRADRSRRGRRRSRPGSGRRATGRQPLRHGDRTSCSEIVDLRSSLSRCATAWTGTAATSAALRVVRRLTARLRRRAPRAGLRSNGARAACTGSGVEERVGEVEEVADAGGRHSTGAQGVGERLVAQRLRSRPRARSCGGGAQLRSWRISRLRRTTRHDEERDQQDEADRKADEREDQHGGPDAAREVAALHAAAVPMITAMKARIEQADDAGHHESQDALDTVAAHDGRGVAHLIKITLDRRSPKLEVDGAATRRARIPIESARMPTGKVKFYDDEKGFGFISSDDGARSSCTPPRCPPARPSRRARARVRHRRRQARRAGALGARARRPAEPREAEPQAADDMAIIVEDLVKLLDGIGGDLHRGRYPDSGTGVARSRRCCARSRTSWMPEPEDETTPAAVHFDAATADEASSDALSTEASLRRRGARSAPSSSRVPPARDHHRRHHRRPRWPSVEGENAVSLLFEATMAGYPGWHWTVSVGASLARNPTVLEAELMPGDGALLAPDWVPWSDRLADYRARRTCRR